MTVNFFSPSLEFLNSSLVKKFYSLPRREPCSSVFTYKKQAAFTLAETLITLTIIGIIAALTVPNLMTKYEKQVTVTGLKKAYLQLQQAITLSEIENGPESEWDFDIGPEPFFNKYLFPFVKISTKSATDINTPATQYKYLNGKNWTEPNLAHKNSRAFTLKDGTILFLDTWNSGKNSEISIVVDINGRKNPNINGKDVFWFYTSKSSQGKILPFGVNYPREEMLSNKIQRCNKNVEYAGSWCAAVIMLDGWQIKDDYPW